MLLWISSLVIGPKVTEDLAEWREKSAEISSWRGFPLLCCLEREKEINFHF